MGKLKLIWDHHPVASSPYFARQASFSLDHGWTGLNVDFIDQIQRCQPFHQDDLCASIAAAYVAFEQFSTYKTIYTTKGHTQLLPQTYSSKYMHYFTYKLKMLAQRTRTLEPLLAAALGISGNRKFPPGNVDVMVLASVLESVTQGDSGSVIWRFLDSVLPPLAKECEIASADQESRNRFFASKTMQRMHEVVQVIMCNDHTGTYVLLEECPVLSNAFSDSVWNFLTRKTYDDTDHQSRIPQDSDRLLDSFATRANKLELEQFASHMLLLQQGTRNARVAKKTDTSGNKRKRPRDEEPRVEDRTQSQTTSLAVDALE
jgi:hypothetical protein